MNDDSANNLPQPVETFILVLILANVIAVISFDRQHPLPPVPGLL
jgi:hypothetical protein